MASECSILFIKQEKSERFLIKMEIPNAYFMVENTCIFSRTKRESHSEL